MLPFLWIGPSGGAAAFSCAQEIEEVEASAVPAIVLLSILRREIEAIWTCLSNLVSARTYLIIFFADALLRGNSRGVEVRQRLRLLLHEFGMRQRLARDHLFPHGGVIDEDGFHHSHLLQVRWLQVFIRVHVGMVGACRVVHVILDELEARDADRIK